MAATVSLTDLASALRGDSRQTRIDPRDTLARLLRQGSRSPRTLPEGIRQGGEKIIAALLQKQALEDRDAEIAARQTGITDTLAQAFALSQGAPATPVAPELADTTPGTSLAPAGSPGGAFQIPGAPGDNNAALAALLRNPDTAALGAGQFVGQMFEPTLDEEVERKRRLSDAGRVPLSEVGPRAAAARPTAKTIDEIFNEEAAKTRGGAVLDKTPAERIADAEKSLGSKLSDTEKLGFFTSTSRPTDPNIPRSRQLAVADSIVREQLSDLVSSTDQFGTPVIDPEKRARVAGRVLELLNEGKSTADIVKAIRGEGSGFRLPDGRTVQEGAFIEQGGQTFVIRNGKPVPF